MRTSPGHRGHVLVSFRIGPVGITLLLRAFREGESVSDSVGRFLKYKRISFFLELFGPMRKEVPYIISLHHSE